MINVKACNQKNQKAIMNTTFEMFLLQDGSTRKGIWVN